MQGSADDEVSIGDTYQIGTTLMEVTQPRVTCYRLGIRMNRPDMAALVVAHHRPGFYFPIPWDTRFASLLEFAEACEVPVRWSCRTGVCHTCVCALVGGELEYDPDPLQMPAAGNLLICCSRPRGIVEIDL